MGKLDEMRATELVVGGRTLVVLSMPSSRPLDLTPAEEEVCVRLLAGATLGEIARARGTAERTVDKQVQSIYRKLEVRSRRELAARFTAPAAPVRAEPVTGVRRRLDPLPDASRARGRSTPQDR